MRVNQEVVKSILEVFMNSTGLSTDYNDIVKSMPDYSEDEIIFHLQILNDQSLIEQINGGTGIGYQQGIDGEGVISIIPLRATTFAHQYYEIITTPEIWVKIKSELKDATVGSVFKIGKEAMELYLKNKAKVLFGDT